MTAEEYGGKRYNEMTSEERYKRLVKMGKNPHDQGRGFCHDCGYFPAFIPAVMVANRTTLTSDKYRLQLPHLCDGCIEKRGLTRYGCLIPKAEGQNYTQAIESFLEIHPEWIKKAQDKGVKDLMEQGMSEEDAKGMLGVQ